MFCCKISNKENKQIKIKLKEKLKELLISNSSILNCAIISNNGELMYIIIINRSEYSSNNLNNDNSKFEDISLTISGLLAASNQFGQTMQLMNCNSIHVMGNEYLCSIYELPNSKYVFFKIYKNRYCLFIQQKMIFQLMF